MKIAKIVSGGQTGVDQGALDACIWIDFPYGGWVPKGRKTEAGSLPLAFKGMQEHSSAKYLPRTEANVVDSDATLVLTHGKPTGGTKKTVEFAKKHGRPWHRLDMSKPLDAEVQEAMEWLKKSCPDNCVLNVAGPRESKKPGIQKVTIVWVLQILGKANGTCFYPPPMEKPLALDEPDGKPLTEDEIALAELCSRPAWMVVVHRKPASKSSRLLSWETNGYAGIDWLLHLVKEGKATDLGGHDGYPRKFGVKAKDLLLCLADCPPDIVQDSTMKWDASAIKVCKPNEDLLVEAWDLS